MTHPRSNHRLCMENRMLVATATGVATYARALHRAQRTLSADALILSGGNASAPGAPNSRISRLVRSMRSIVPWGVRAHAGIEGKNTGAAGNVNTGNTFIHHDVFRLGQAFFTLHGRPMPVHVPGPPGIMHWSYPVPLHVAGWRNIYTIHDVIPLTHPDLSPIDAKRHRRLLLSLAARADKLVAVSRFAAQETAAALDLDTGQVVDCSQPIEVEGAADLPLPEKLEPGRYFLVCGTVEPRKNIKRIAAAYRTSGTALPLVIAGPDGWKADDLAPVLAGTPGLVRLPYQTRASMISLVAQARALLMPSLAEGFGLPVGEAMALGTPVLTSAEGALAETVGDAAMRISPLDTPALSRAIANLAADDALCANLAEAGRKRVALFSPTAFAARLGALYDEVAADS
jgi:glycosyltransferase involved in cell wall biosynthesis